MKARLSAKFILKISFHSYANKTNCYMKSFALSLAFIMRFTKTRKWSIISSPALLFLYFNIKYNNNNTLLKIDSYKIFEQKSFYTFYKMISLVRATCIHRRVHKIIQNHDPFFCALYQNKKFLSVLHFSKKKRQSQRVSQVKPAICYQYFISIYLFVVIVVSLSLTFAIATINELPIP